MTTESTEPNDAPKRLNPNHVAADILDSAIGLLRQATAETPLTKAERQAVLAVIRASAVVVEQGEFLG